MGTGGAEENGTGADEIEVGGPLDNVLDTADNGIVVGDGDVEVAILLRDGDAADIVRRRYDAGTNLGMVDGIGKLLHRFRQQGVLATEIGNVAKGDESVRDWFRRHSYTALLWRMRATACGLILTANVRSRHQLPAKLD